MHARRSIPDSAGQQTKELHCSIKDEDGQTNIARPNDPVLLARLLARGKAMRDLQAMLTGAKNAQATDMLKAFNLVCWLLPIAEKTGLDTDVQIGQQICNKAKGLPLTGFSDCSAYSVWAALPESLTQAVSKLADADFVHVFLLSHLDICIS